MADNDRAPELHLVIEHLPAGFDALREEARAEGKLFVERLAADWETRRMRFDREGEALLAAHITGVLAGIGVLQSNLFCPCACGGFTSDRCSGELALAASWRAGTTGLLVTVNAAPASVSFWESLGFAPDMRDGHTHLYRGVC